MSFSRYGVVRLPLFQLPPFFATLGFEEEKKSKERYGSLGFCVETNIFVWFVWIVMGWYEFVDFYMNLS